MAKKILITGSTGFIGSFLAEEAVSQGFDVVAGIRKTSNRKFLQQLDIEYAELNLSDPVQLQEQLAAAQRRGSFDYVIHNAGITHAKKHEDFITSNYQYTRHLAEALQASGADLQKFILVSSLASFGPGGEQFQPICSNKRKEPMSVYGRSKMMAEEYIARQKAFPHLIINPTAVYGPRDQGFLPFFQMIQKGIETYVGGKDQRTSMIYVKDLASAIIRLAGNGVANRSFIVSDMESYPKDMLGTIAKKLLQKKTVKLRLPLPLVSAAAGFTGKIHKLVKGYEPFLNSEKLREISQPNWLCDSSETWAVLNDRPKYSLEEGFRETIEWYRENRWL